MHRDEDDAHGDDNDEEDCDNDDETLSVTMTKTMMHVRIWKLLLSFSREAHTTNNGIPVRVPRRRHAPPADALERRAASRGPARL